MSNTIIVESLGDARIITLNRPDKLNAFTGEMLLALRAALEQANSDENCRAVLITGAGRGFCAGQDLGERDPEENAEARDLSQTLTTYYLPVITLIKNMQKPVICAVNGVAAGAGANLALLCDIVIAGKSAKFIQAFIKIGLVPDAGGTWSLTQLLGPARAKALAMTGEALPASTAQDWGLIWKCVEDDELRDVATKMIEQMAEGPTFAYGLHKQAFAAAATNTLDEQLMLEAQLQREAGYSPDYREGVSAFLQKRPANFTGKAADIAANKGEGNDK